MAEKQGASLQKTLGFWSLWAMGVGSVIGDGIFLLMGDAIVAAGPGAFIPFAVAGFIQIAMMIGMSELAVAVPSPGAMALWVERFISRGWGFVAGVTYIFGYIITGATCGIAIGRFTCYWFPQLDSTLWTIIFALGLNFMFALLNYFGAAVAAKAQLVMTLILVIIMAGFAIFGARYMDMENFKPLFTNGMDGFIAAIPSGMYAYMGAVCLCCAGAECRKPTDLGRALIWSGVTFVVMYGACQIVATGIINYSEASLKISIFTLAAERIFGPFGGTLLNIAAWLAAATCLLMGSFYTSSRVMYQLAKSGGLSQKFATVHPKYKTPAFGIWVTFGFVALFTIIAYFSTDEVYTALCNQNVLVWMVAWGLALLCSFVLRKNYKNLIRQSGWRQPLYPLFPVIGIIGVIYTAFLVATDGIVHLLITAAWVGCIALYYFLVARKKYVGVLGDEEDMAAVRLSALKTDRELEEEALQKTADK